MRPRVWPIRWPRARACASEAFFPFADGLLEAVAAGATAVIQPGGSMRDAEVIAAADEARHRHGLHRACGCSGTNPGALWFILVADLP